MLVSYNYGHWLILQFPVDEEFQKLWRSIAVDSLDDMKIEEYLEKTGFAFMQVCLVMINMKQIKQNYDWY